MDIAFDRRLGLYVLLRKASFGRDAVGFKIGLKSRRLYSERNDGYRHSACIGPLYFRTYKRRNPLRLPKEPTP